MHNSQLSLLALALSVPLAGCLCADDPGTLVAPTVDEDPSLPAIEVNGTRLHAETFGPADGPVLIVMHGGPGSDYRWLLPLSELADDGYRVVFWDQRSTGLSRRHDPSEIDLDIYLEDLRQVIDHYAGDRPYVFLAQSWGAMYATAFINRNADDGGRIRGAIYTEPGGFTSAQLDGFIDRLQGSMSVISEQFNDALWAEQFLSRADHERADYRMSMLALRGAPSEHNDPDNPAPLWRSGAVANRRLLELAKTDFDWTTNLDAFPHRVLFLRGDLNSAATLAHQQELAASYPDAVIETVPDVGHHLIWERTDEYLTHARAYLREIGFVP
jgi:proline iminopeptidase